MPAKVMILGGGLAGLSAAWHLQNNAGDFASPWPATLLERDREAGGLVRTDWFGPYAFDRAAHIFFTAEAHAIRVFHQVLGDAEVQLHRAEVRVFSKDVLTQFPFQFSLHGLPPEVVTDCLVGAHEAALQPPAGPGGDFRSWVLAGFGEGIARHFMFPYNTKLWGKPPEELTADWVDNKVILPDFREMVRGAVSDRAYEHLPNRVFRYPLHGGIGAYSRGLASGVPDLRTGEEVVEVSLERREVRTRSGGTYPFQVAIWALPLQLLPKLVPGLPDRVAEAVRALVLRRVVCVNIAAARESLATWHWMYFPEPEYPFFRVSFPSNLSPHLAPRGHSSILCEIAVPATGALDLAALRREAVTGLERAGLLVPGEPLEVCEAVVLDPAYVVYDHGRKANLGIIHAWMDENDLLPAGRFAEWAFFNMDHTLLSGRRAAVEAVERLRGKA